MSFEIQQEEKFRFVEVGMGEPILLLHGLLGALSNFQWLVEYFRTSYKVIFPILPLLDTDILHTSVGGMEKFIHRFIEYKGYQNIHIIGNSLGGHIALLYVLKHPEKIKSITLTGSSGLFESGMGDTFPKRGDYEYIKKKTELTFYDPAMATKELVDEVFELTRNRLTAIKIIALAKSAIRNNLGEEISKITQPSLLIWGKNDVVTPPFVAHEFNKLLPNSELHFIDECGHAPMMEVPEAFNRILASFLQKLQKSKTLI